MTHSPALLKVPPTVVSLADHEQHARQQLDDNAWAYFSGGAADEITLRANRSAWDALPLWPRVLRPLAGGHTRVSLLGRTLAHPILLAPIAFQRMAHPDGELATAYAAAALGAGLVLSTQASVERVQAGSELAHNAGGTMAEVVSSIRSVSELMQEISHASSSQTNDMLNVTQAIVRMDEATQQNAALVEESAAAAGSLSTQARELVQAVAVFRLRRQGGHATALLR